MQLADPIQRDHARDQHHLDPGVFQSGLDHQSDSSCLGHLEKSRGQLGFRYSDQVFKHFNDFVPDGEDYFAVHGYTEMFGFWARPIHALRLNFNQEYTSFDNVIVSISPRKQSQYRFQAGYTPSPWAVLGGSINIFQQSNGDSATNYQGHNRNYGLTASLAPTSASPSIWHTTTTMSCRTP